MCYKAIDVARYIIDKCEREDNPISNLQLQKILFFIQKEYLQNQQVLAFSDSIQAWKFGPVVPNVYYQFSGYGASPITLKYTDLNIKDSDKQYIDPIIEEKRGMYPWDLVKETHKSGSAWSIIYNNGLGEKKVIPVKLIADRG